MVSVKAGGWAVTSGRYAGVAGFGAGLGAVAALRYFAGAAFLRTSRFAGFEVFTALARAAVPDLRTVLCFGAAVASVAVASTIATMLLMSLVILILQLVPLLVTVFSGVG